MDVVATSKSIGLVMMHAGERLHHVMREEMHPDAVNETFRQVVYGLRFLHAKNIIHCNLKKVPWISVLAQIIQAALGYIGGRVWNYPALRYPNRGRPHCQTFSCRAPEIALGSKTCTSVDVWSLGVLLFNMAVGRISDFLTE